MEEIHSGLIVYRASRLEGLLEALTYFVDKHPPSQVLAPQTVIAAHPGMKHWLSAELARKRCEGGASGIAANLDIVLPSAWLDRLAMELQGESAVALAPYQRGGLRWRIHEILPTLDDEQVRAYLKGSDQARRRFQLADRLARIYTQYIVYRPDWLDAWAAGKRVPLQEGTGSREHDLLASLWATLRQQIGLPHRGELLAQMRAGLASGRHVMDEAEPLHVFGVSHLAPSELSVLAAVARRRPVVLYVPDPCREYWLDQRSDREELRQRVETAPYDHETESLFLQLRHPLLGAWGRMGQHFLLALEGLDMQVDIRHWGDKSEATPAAQRLPRLQESIRRFDPSLLAPVGDLSSQRADASLRVHACHTRLRELEVLRDALLKARVDQPDLRPRDIVVMAPDIQAYVPLLPAVFGEPGEHQGPLPYHIADVSISRSHSLLEAFRRLLDFPQSRITAPEVVDLLGVPEIARRFGLADADTGVLVGWLRNSRVAWALDEKFRAGLGVPAIAEHTFAWGMDRMMAGYIMGASADVEDNAVTLPDGKQLAPLAGIHGPQAALLGALDGLLVQLARLHEVGRQTLSASEWAKQLEQVFDALFRIDKCDADARDAETLVRQFIRSIAGEPQQSGLDPELEFSVVRELLLERLTAAPERQRFLMGGVTFCGMVPQRAIPFRVVAVLSLNDGDFPRAGSDGGLDLMTTHRRLGDRDVRSDDRYLFLETVMSARDMLHLSYIGEGVRNGKPRNPAAPLAELLEALENAAGPDSDDSTVDRPWLVRHPLQPFDVRYFDRSDAALFSFSQGHAAMDRRGIDLSAAPPFVGKRPSSLPQRNADTPPPIALRPVFAYFCDPAKQLLASGLNLRLDALDEDRLRDSEPLEAKFEGLDQVARRVFNAVVAQAVKAVPDEAPDWMRLSGLMPPGAVGEEAWAKTREQVADLLKVIGNYPLFDPSLPDATPVLIDRQLTGQGNSRLQGELHRVYDVDGTRWVFDVFPGKTEDQLDFKARVGFFLEWALVRLDDPSGQREVRACVLAAPKRGVGTGDWQGSFDVWSDTFMQAVRNGNEALRRQMINELERQVTGLIDFYQDAQHAPLWYFPKTSWAAAESPQKTRETWVGGYNMGERDYSPGYGRLLAGEREFDETGDYEQLLETANRLRALITLLPQEASA
ncbi:exodeoxyribonuclease V subunit gamma [Lysobacter sp. A289]